MEPANSVHFLGSRVCTTPLVACVARGRGGTPTLGQDNMWQGAADGVLKQSVEGQGGQDALPVYKRASAAILEVTGHDVAAEHQEKIRTVLKMLCFELTQPAVQVAKYLEGIPDALLQDAGVTRPETTADSNT